MLFHIWSEHDPTSANFKSTFEKICQKFWLKNFECVHYEGSKNEIPGSFKVKTFPSIHAVRNRDYMSLDSKGPIAYTGTADEEKIMSFVKIEYEKLERDNVKEDL